MTQESSEALRAALDRVDRERTRSKVMLFCLLGLTFGMWIGMMFAKDDHTGLPFAVCRYGSKLSFKLPDHSVCPGGRASGRTRGGDDH